MRWEGDGRWETDLISPLAGLVRLLGERVVPRWLRECVRRRPQYGQLPCFLCFRLRRHRIRLARKRGHKLPLLHLAPSHGYPLRVERCTGRQIRRRGGIRRPGTVCAGAAANDAHCGVWY
jgi:hypothetical protein